MPFRRKFRKVRKKRAFKRRYTRTGSIRKSKRGPTVFRVRRHTGTVYNIRSTSATTGITLSGATGSDSINFLGIRLQDVPAYTDFTALYDQYKIKSIRMNFIPIMNVSTFGLTGGPHPLYANRCFSALDWTGEDAGVTGVDNMREYRNCRWSTYNRVHKRYFFPRISFETDTSEFYNFKQQPWLSTSNVATVHQGIYFGFKNEFSIPPGTTIYLIEAMVYLAFRNLR